MLLVKLRAEALGLSFSEIILLLTSYAILERKAVLLG